MRSDLAMVCVLNPFCQISRPYYLFRPEDIIHDDESQIKACVAHKAFHNAYILYTLSLPSGQKILAYVLSHHNHSLTSSIGIRFEAQHVICFGC